MNVHLDEMSEMTAAPAELAQTYLGNVSESADLTWRVAQGRENGCCLEVTIASSDRTKGRILARSRSGKSVGIIKERDWLLRDGDVLATDQRHLVFVSLQQQPVMTLRFDPAVGNSAIALVRLGHVLGNHHWPVAVQGEVLYVSLVAEAAQMEATLHKMVAVLALEGLIIGYEMREADYVSAQMMETGVAHHSHA